METTPCSQPQSLNYLYISASLPFLWPHVSVGEFDEIYKSIVEEPANMCAHMHTYTYSQLCILFPGNHGPPVLGSSPGGSRVIRRWGRSRHLWKNTYLITDIEKLEMDSAVGRLVEKKRLNNLDYVE